MIAITTKQSDILRFIANFISINSRSPKQIEIKSHFNFRAVSSVYKHLNYMEKKGLVSRSRYSRSIIVTSHG